jgi:dethiobiotin synthetase
VVTVVGTGTDVGKTWVAARMLQELRQAGSSVAARKPAQSFDAGDDPASHDATVLGGASGESPETVCLPHRWYEAALAPPMAADLLGRPPFSVSDLLDECRWPDAPVDVGLVETAGGLRSPIADDGDCLSLVRGLAPDLVVLVADAGLGTINAVRLTAQEVALARAPIVVVLNRYEPSSELHRRNLAWLCERDGLSALVTPGDEGELARLARA